MLDSVISYGEIVRWQRILQLETPFIMICQLSGSILNGDAIIKA